MNPPTLSRRAPPYVPPVEKNGIKYEQIMNGIDAGLPNLTGNLAAVGSDGQRLWTLSVYSKAMVPGLEADVQWVYFKSMAFDADGKLRITNESGKAYLVDVDARSVVAAP